MTQQQAFSALHGGGPSKRMPVHMHVSWGTDVVRWALRGRPPLACCLGMVREVLCVEGSWKMQNAKGAAALGHTANKVCVYGGVYEDTQEEQAGCHVN